MQHQSARGRMTAALLTAALSMAGGLSLVPEAAADVVNINTCWSSCTGLSNVTIATLGVSQAGTGSVNFALTNLVGNLSVATADSFISQLNHTYTGSSTLTFTAINTSAVGSFSFTEKAPFTAAGLSFNLSDSFPTSNVQNRFLHGETLTWNLQGSGLTASQFLSGLNGQSQFAMVHAQGLQSVDGSTKFVNGVSVPEPTSLLLLGAGLAGVGIWRRKAA